MQSSLSLSLLTKALAFSSCLFMPFIVVHAEKSSYYSNDIDEAVRSVKKNPNASQHVGKRWYGRTTSRSFGFAPLLNTEMDQEIIEGAMGPTAAGEAAAAQANAPAKEAALGHKGASGAVNETLNEQRSTQAKVPTELPQAELLLNSNASSSTNYGDASITGIRGGTIQRSYHTPKSTP